MNMRGFLERAARWIGLIWAQVGVLVLFLFILNAAAGLIVKTATRYRKRVHPAPEDAYKGSAWSAPYFKALKHTSTRWYPYVYWKSSPMSSRYLNVDRQGDRATWNRTPRGAGGGRPLRIFTFGGSTMWGVGVRDDYTLASLLSRRLAEKSNYDVEVSNYGQIGYVSTQEVLLLYQLLADGMRPDVVVFYDGINDCFAAYQSGIAGLTQNEAFRVREFNLVGGNKSRRRNLYLTAIRTLFFHSNAAKLGRLIAGKDADEEAGENVEARQMLSYLAPGTTGTQPGATNPAGALEQAVVNRYLFNQRMVLMLGRQFGFRSLFYWQPAIFFKDKLTPHERSFVGDPQREQFFLAAYRRMAAAAPENGVRDLSGIFKNKSETLFTDAWHPTESGDESIARIMAGDVAGVLAEIERERGTHPGRTEATPAPQP